MIELKSFDKVLLNTAGLFMLSYVAVIIGLRAVGGVEQRLRE